MFLCLNRKAGETSIKKRVNIDNVLYYERHPQGTRIVFRDQGSPDLYVADSPERLDEILKCVQFGEENAVVPTITENESRSRKV